MIIPANVIVQALKSGECSIEKHRVFLNDVLRPLMFTKFLPLLDSWRTQADLTRFTAVFPNQDSQLLIFPEGSTGCIRPQDLSLFRSWQYFHGKIEHYTPLNRTEVTIDGRQGFINTHVIIHNQLSTPQFRNLIKSRFVQAKITNETVGEICKPKDICFKLGDI